MVQVTIGGLKRVRLRIGPAGADDETGEWSGRPVSFIYGAGSRGLTLFEQCLEGKGIGESLKIQIKQEEMATFFGHLHSGIVNGIGIQIMPREFTLLVTVDRIEEGDQREIVRAIAQALPSGCGGACDCGCG